MLSDRWFLLVGRGRLDDRHGGNPLLWLTCASLRAAGRLRGRAVRRDVPVLPFVWRGSPQAAGDPDERARRPVAEPSGRPSTSSTKSPTSAAASRSRRHRKWSVPSSSARRPSAKPAANASRSSAGQYSSSSPASTSTGRRNARSSAGGQRRQGQVVRAERHADQHERGDAVVVERLAQRDVGAERPPAHHGGQVRGLLADALDRARTSRSSSRPAAVRAARAHDPAEVEPQHGEAARARELVAQRPQDRVVLAAAVPWVGVAEHGGAAGRRVGRAAISPSSRTPSSVVNVIASTVCDDGSRERGARQPSRGTARRSPCAIRWPWAGSSSWLDPGESGSDTGRCSCPRSRVATRSRRSRPSRERRRRLLLGTGVVPMTSRDARAHRDGRRDGARTIGRASRCSASEPGRRDARAPSTSCEAQVREIRSDRADGPGVGPRRDLGLLSLDRPRARSGSRRSVHGRCALAGRVADGVLLNWCTPERVAAGPGSSVTEAAESSRARPRRRSTVAAYIRRRSVTTSPARRRSRSSRRARRASTPRYPAYAGSSTRWASARRPSSRGRPTVRDAPTMWRRCYDAVCLVGERGARARLAAYRDAGCDLPVVYPVPGSGPTTRSRPHPVVGTLRGAGSTVVAGRSARRTLGFARSTPWKRGLWHDLHDRRALHRHEGPRVRRRMSRRLHLRGSSHALHPARRVRRLRRVRAGLPRDRDLLRGRRARASGSSSRRSTPSGSTTTSAGSGRPVAPRRWVRRPSTTRSVAALAGHLSDRSPTSSSSGPCSARRRSRRSGLGPRIGAEARSRVTRAARDAKVDPDGRPRRPPSRRGCGLLVARARSPPDRCRRSGLRHRLGHRERACRDARPLTVAVARCCAGGVVRRDGGFVGGAGAVPARARPAFPTVYE